MSNTPYKDELIRIIAAMGLPDDTDPVTIADLLAPRLAEAGAAGRRVEAETTIRQTAERDRERYRTGLAAARDRLEAMATAMRTKAARPGLGSQAYADLAELEQLAVTGAQLAAMALSDGP